MKQESETRPKESDYGHTQELFGTAIQNAKEREKINYILLNLDPKEEKDFLILAKAIANRVGAYNSVTKSIYIDLIENVTKEVTEQATVDDLNDLINFVTATLNDKIKKSKPKTKLAPAKKKLNITKGNDVDFDDLDIEIDRDDGDDFM